MNKSIKTRFTLIELLLVMGLMGLMVTIALPAFSRMTGNNKLDVMASNIKIALEQGQSTAVSRNCYVAVVFPNAVSDDEAYSYAYSYGGYRLAEVTTTDGANFVFKRWISDSYLNKPDGAYLVEARATVLKAGKDSAAANFNGAELNGNVKGFLPADGIDEELKSSVIFKPTGESVNNEMYLVIASGSVAGTTLKTEKPEDFRQLKLNPFTGRVEYVSDEDSTSTGGAQ